MHAKTSFAGTEAGIKAFKAGNYEKAFEELKPDAGTGDAVAQYYLGSLYYRGLHVNRNLTEARAWFSRAAESGHPDAQASLAYMYAHGRGVRQDYENGRKWYRKAAEQGHVIAQRNLGLMYEDGRGVDYDAEEAAGWFRRAAVQGDAVAQTHLGQFLWMGQGPIPRDRAGGLDLLKRAAQQDHAHAQYLYCANRTELHAQRADALVDAFMWCRLAADQGYPGGEQMWEAAERWFISMEQKDRAAELAAEWRAQHR